MRSHLVLSQSTTLSRKQQGHPSEIEKTRRGGFLCGAFSVRTRGEFLYAVFSGRKRSMGKRKIVKSQSPRTASDQQKN